MTPFVPQQSLQKKLSLPLSLSLLIYLQTQPQSKQKEAVNFSNLSTHSQGQPLTSRSKNTTQFYRPTQQKVSTNLKTTVQPPLRTFALGEAKNKRQEGTLPGKEKPNYLPRTDLFLSKTNYWQKAKHWKWKDLIKSLQIQWGGGS